MQGDVLVHLILGFEALTDDVPLVNVDDALRLHSVIIVIVERLLDGRKYFEYLVNALAQGHWNIIPLAGLDIFDQRINWQVRMVRTLSMSRIECQTYFFFFIWLGSYEGMM